MEIPNDFPSCIAMGNQVWVTLKSGKLQCMDPISHETHVKTDMNAVNALCSFRSSVWGGCDGSIVSLEHSVTCNSVEGLVDIRGISDISCLLALSTEQLLICDNHGSVTLFSFKLGKVIAKCEVDGNICCSCVVNSYLTWIAVGTELYVLHIAEKRDNISCTLIRHVDLDNVSGMTYVKGQIWSCGESVLVWDAQTRELLLTIRSTSSYCMYQQFGLDGCIVIWDCKKRTMVQTITASIEESNVACMLQSGIKSVLIGIRSEGGDGALF
jgi:hypothetical protein